MVKLIKADFDGRAMQFNDAGWFNATAAAEKFGKLPANWLSLPSTDSYIDSMSRALNVGKSDIIKTSRGRNG